ncbi:T-cell receptor alpha chain V region HPB-MLT [Heterocephalus glaber]|nr:T-cell receptor alpha chain V region HPB-MLT [Heterocephalus glaber]
MLLSSLLWVFLTIIYSGYTVAQKVTQVQPAASRPEGKAVTLNCSYETSVRFYDLFWYQQLLSGEMVLLIHQGYSGDHANTGHYSVDFQKAAKTITLTISALQIEDSAKCLCALSEHTIVEVTVKAEQKLRSSVRDRPCSRSLAKTHTCKSQIRREHGGCFICGLDQKIKF